MSHANKMHDGLAADIELFDDDAASAIGKMLDDTLAECWVALSLPKDEAFTAKLTPIDYRSLTKRMAVRKHHKQALIPKRSNVAIGRLDRIGYERQIKLSPSNKSNLFRRRLHPQAFESLPQDAAPSRPVSVPAGSRPR
jgi:hypothetical protein